MRRFTIALILATFAFTASGCLFVPDHRGGGHYDHHDDHHDDHGNYH